MDGNFISHLGDEVTYRSVPTAKKETQKREKKECDKEPKGNTRLQCEGTQTHFLFLYAFVQTQTRKRRCATRETVRISESRKKQEVRPSETALDDLPLSSPFSLFRSVEPP